MKLLLHRQEWGADMSLILDALNRAEQDRKNKEGVPNLNTLHQAADYAAVAAPKSKFGLWLSLVIACLLLAVASGWYFSGSGRAASSTTVLSISKRSTPEPSTTTAVTQVAPVVEIVARPEPESSHVKSPDETVKVDQLYAAEEPAAAALDPTIDELYTADDEPVESESIVDSLVIQAAQPLTADRIEPRNVAIISRAAADSTVTVARTYDSMTDVTAFNDLPWNLKQQIPTISYSRHNYAANNISSVVINGQTSGQGNLVSGDFVVQEILADGVVLRFKDKVFKLRALNGWVNM